MAGRQEESEKIISLFQKEYLLNTQLRRLIAKKQPERPPSFVQYLNYQNHYFTK
jgi:hypothetical protein